MSIHPIWLNANPELREELRQANEARAAAFHAAWKAGLGVLGAPFRGLAEAIRQARRARATYRELAALSDHQLADVGLTRGEIRDIAKAAAARQGGSVTLAELRGAGPGAGGGTTALPAGEGRRHRRPAPWQARRPAGHERAAA